MSSLRLERVKQQHPGVATLLERLSGYIQHQTAVGQPYIIPKLAAAALKLNDGEAFMLLDMLAKGKVLQRVYNVYCRTQNALLATVESLEKLDEVAQCDFCNTEHDPSELKVEISFAPVNGDSRDLAA